MPTRKPGTYRVVAVSLYAREADEADRLTDVLKRAGWPKANRSLIVREALLRLEQDLDGKDDEAVFRYFVDRHARRIGASRNSLSKPADADAATGQRQPRNLLDIADRNQ